MITSGFDALDHRIGGLLLGRHYLLTGGRGSGKTSMAIHFLAAGLEQGEQCAVLTHDDPRDLLVQAEYLGHDFRGPVERGQLTVLEYRGDFIANYTQLKEPTALLEELRELAGGQEPRRFVIDSGAPFVGAEERVGEGRIRGLSHLLREIAATTFLTAPEEIAGAALRSMKQPGEQAPAAVFHLRPTQEGYRELTMLEIRQATASRRPIAFEIVPGVGIVTARDGGSRAEQPGPLDRRVLLVETTSGAPRELRRALEERYDLTAVSAARLPLREIARGDFTLLIVALDPAAHWPGVAIAREVRRIGYEGGLLLAASRDLWWERMRARALRAGADDLIGGCLTIDESVSRVERALASEGDRGSREERPQPRRPRVGNGDQRELLKEDELRSLVLDQIESASHPFFALLFLPPSETVSELARIISGRIDPAGGDLIATGSDGGLLVYLHEASRRHVLELLGAVLADKPEATRVDDVLIYGFPADRSLVEAWAGDEKVLARPAAE